MHSDNSYRTTPQAPIHSGFGPHTTARDVLHGQDVRGKTAIVTGGYGGIGLETTRALAEAGATVIVPARTPAKARASLGGMPHVELEEMDLIDPSSVDACAQRFLYSGRALHMLINNAGIMAPPLQRDARLRIPVCHESSGALPVDSAALAGLATGREGTGRFGLFQRDQLRGRRF